MGLSLQDPHQELKGKNVLIIRSSLELTAARFGLEQGRLSALLLDSQHRLRAARAQRPRPHLDTKMLASWNGEQGPGGASAPCTLLHVWDVGLVWVFFSFCSSSPVASREQQNSLHGAACSAGLPGDGLPGDGDGGSGPGSVPTPVSAG